MSPIGSKSEIVRLYKLVLDAGWIPEVEEGFLKDFYVVSYNKIPSREVVPHSTFLAVKKIDE